MTSQDYKSALSGLRVGLAQNGQILFISGEQPSLIVAVD